MVYINPVGKVKHPINLINVNKNKKEIKNHASRSFVVTFSDMLYNVVSALARIRHRIAVSSALSSKWLYAGVSKPCIKKQVLFSEKAWEKKINVMMCENQLEVER